MTTNSHGSLEARLLLERVIITIKNAETLVFDARNLHTTGVVPRLYGQLNLPVPVTQERFYCWNSAETSYVRVESACAVREMSMTTLFIKNRDGIWHVLPQCAAEISGIFAHDRLLGTFPFFRLFSTLEYPYDLSVNESDCGTEQVVVKGLLTAKPLHRQEDIASDFSYRLDTKSRRLFALDERTFGGRSLHLEFDRWSINEPIDHKLFDIPAKFRVKMSSMSQYMDLKQQYYGNRFMEQ